MDNKLTTIKQDINNSNIPCAMVVFKINNFKILCSNDIYDTVFGVDNGEYLNVLSEDISIIKEQIKSQSTATVEYRFIDKKGNLKCAYMTLKNIDDEYAAAAVCPESTVNGVYRVYKEALNNSKIMVMEIDVENDTCRIMSSGIGQTVFIGNFSENGTDVVFNQKQDIEYILDVNNTEPYVLKIKACDKDEWRWYMMYKNVVFNESGKFIYGALCNIDSQKKTEETLISKIKIDPLTKVYSREAGKEKIEENLIVCQKRSDYALFVLDIDNFKMINDTFGHLYGDAVLTMAASCIKSSVDNDDIVGRFGGDEFFVFVKNSDVDTIMKKADKINKSILSMRTNISDDNDIACSIGVAIGTTAADTYQDLFEKADIALYKAKNEGKNCIIVYNDDMRGETGGSLCYDQDDANENKTQSHDLTRVALEIAARSTSFQNAVHMIMRHIGLSLDVDDVKIMRVKFDDDRVSIEHHWSKMENVAERDNRTGYYLHEDIVNLRRLFEKEPLFVVSEASKEGFSEKFVHELDKLNDKSVIYTSSLTRDNSFFYIILSCFTPNRKWSEDTRKMISDLTKVLVVYLQKNLTEVVFPDDDPMSIEPHTKLLYYDKFMEQSELMRKLVHESKEKVALIHADFSNAHVFAKQYGMHCIDRVFVEYSAKINKAAKARRDSYISSHIYGTTQFISLVRYKNDINEVKKQVLNFNNSFCKFQKTVQSNFDFVIDTAICELENGESLPIRLDDLRLEKQQKGEAAECTCYILE